MPRLIVNADDFGRSTAINEAVFRAHEDGILTTASLMVNGDAFDEAVAYARAHPRLGVGLHLTLLCGKSTLAHTEIPGLVNRHREFSDDPVKTGCRYFFLPSLRDQLRREIAAQFEKFQTAGLPLDHVNGHLNLHLHPVIFDLLMEQAGRFGIRHFRVTRDWLRLDLQLSRGYWGYRLSHALIFTVLSWRARNALRQRDVKFTDAVFGLLRNGRVTVVYVLNLLSRLPEGTFELYAHPSAHPDTDELLAFLSPKVKNRLRELDIRLIRYQDLTHG